MKFLIRTTINSPFEKIVSGFDKKLFEALKPPLIDLLVERFDGCKIGDQVHLKLSFMGINKSWVSVISDYLLDSDEFYFVDEGKTLPFPLKRWKHTHKVLRHQNSKSSSSEIQDMIEYGSGNYLCDVLLLPLLYFQFSLRPAAYRRYFKDDKS